MTIRTKVLAAAAALALISGTGAVATSAWASSPGCAFSNGCATLHGTDASGNTVAMDAKYQNKSEILIGYVDNAGDGATSFDGVLHYGKGAKTTTYQDTACRPTSGTTPAASSRRSRRPSAARSPPAPTSSLSRRERHDVRHVRDSPGYTGRPAGTVIDETYGTNCVAAYTYVGPGWTQDLAGSISRVTPEAASRSSPTPLTLPGRSVRQSLPSGIGEQRRTERRPLTARPDTYSSVSVSYTDANGAEITYAFELVVSGIKSTTPGVGVPYYTFVYAPKGDWTSQCVTDINGSGALKLYPCTLGKDTGQDFTINSASGLLDGSQYHVSNWLAAAVGAKSCLTDPSTSAAATPQTDAADELAPGGRQLYVNGSCAANTNLWSWGT